jgi:hypothetical protein
MASGETGGGVPGSTIPSGVDFRVPPDVDEFHRIITSEIAKAKQT